MQQSSAVPTDDEPEDSAVLISAVEPQPTAAANRQTGDSNE